MTTPPKGNFLLHTRWLSLYFGSTLNATTAVHILDTVKIWQCINKELILQILLYSLIVDYILGVFASFAEESAGTIFA